MITKVVNEYCSCALFASKQHILRNKFRGIFPHECAIPSYGRQKPSIVSDQTLRNMRHQG